MVCVTWRTANHHNIVLSFRRLFNGHIYSVVSHARLNGALDLNKNHGLCVSLVTTKSTQLSALSDLSILQKLDQNSQQFKCNTLNRIVGYKIACKSSGSTSLISNKQTVTLQIKDQRNEITYLVFGSFKSRARWEWRDVKKAGLDVSAKKIT